MPDNRKPLIYGAFPVCRNYTVRAHFRDDGAPKRRGRQDRVLHARSLLGGLYAGHLRPCDHRRTAQSRTNHGKYPLPCGIALSATRSRWGQRLGQKKAASENGNLRKAKVLEIRRFRGLLASYTNLDILKCSTKRYLLSTANSHSFKSEFKWGYTEIDI